jgi:long-chain acyl-CoA synthetase
MVTEGLFLITILVGKNVGEKYMMRNWTQNYPKGVNPEIDLTKYGSILDLIEETFSKFTSQPAFENMGHTLSFRQIDDLSKNFASFLQNELELNPGDRIAIQMPNLLQYPVALFGALRAGLVVVNTNPLYTPTEMRHQFKDSGAKAIVILANFASHLQEVLPDTDIRSVVITEIGDMLPFPKSLVVNSVVKYVKKMVPAYNIPQAISFNEAIAAGSEYTYERPQVSQKDIAFLQYTGGTTGVSKGAILSHKNILANTLQIVEWMKPRLVAGQETVITALPLYHIFSLTVNCFAIMNYGGKNILITNPRDIPAFIKTLKKQTFTVVTGVNTLFNALMNHPDFNTINFKNLKISVAGAMALQRPVAEKWKQLTKTLLVEGYGLTEASPVVCCNPIIEGLDKLGTIGLPLPSTDVTLLDDQGKSVPLGEPGELAVKGPQVMEGYWQRSDETAKVIKNGWLLTGDVAIRDDQGYFKIVDRKKDMILVSGFNVYPNEIEEVLVAHPSVLEAAAVGIPDEKSGESVKAFVVKKAEVTEAELIEFCRNRLTNYKVPKKIEFKKELPKTNVGKILRRSLRE